MTNQEHVCHWAAIFDAQMNDALSGANNIDVDHLLVVIESTGQIYRSISERSEELIAKIRSEKTGNAPR